MATEMRASEVTVATHSKILLTVQMKIVHVTCMGAAVVSRLTAVIVNKVGQVPTAPCAPALMGVPGLDARLVGTVMHT